MQRRQFLRCSAALAITAPRAFAADTPFRIGAVTDVQYADKDDVPPHFYRAAAGRLADAVAAFNRTDIAFAVHLGDFVDGDWNGLDTVLPVARGLKAPWHFVLGNHDFPAADDKKPLVPARLGMPARYYTFSKGSWDFVVLDGNDLSTYAWPAGSPERTRSTAAHDTQYPAGKPWNGAIGPGQLAWLDAILAKADARRRKVALLCHFPLLGADETLLWNAPEVLALIERHRSVRLWLNGHAHEGGYALRAGIHHLNLKGMLDTPQTAYAVLSFHPGRIEVEGFGREPSRTLALT